MASNQTNQVWSSIDEASRQEVAKQFQQVIKELIDEHFRLNPESAPFSKSQNIHQAIESTPSHPQHGEPTNAIRAA